MKVKGLFWERVAAFYLLLKGYRILGFNYRTRFGEIDIICRDGETIVFVEVKYRKSERFGSAEEFVTEKKIERIIKTARQFISEKRLEGTFRFDVVAINGFKIKHIKNAFEGE